MKRLIFIFVMTIGLTYAMDEATKHIEILRSFKKEEFIKTPLSKEQVQEILKELKDLRSLAGYDIFMDQALFALTEKSELLGNLEQEMPIAEKLVDAGAKIVFFQARSVQMGYQKVSITKSTLATARGDLKKFLEAEWSKKWSDVEWSNSSPVHP